MLEKSNFGSMGFYSLAVLNVVFALSSFVAPPFVNKCGERFTMFLSALCYSTYIASFILASVPDQFPDKEINRPLFITLLFVGAIINGFGCAILWVA